jgi:formylglycine-generating enzyme required for sulfatase activity
VPARIAEHGDWLRRARELAGRRVEHEDARALLEARVARAPIEELDLARRARADGWQLDLARELLAELDRLEERRASVEERLAWAESIEERSVLGTEAVERWTACLFDVARSEVYADLALTPQLGLLPLGKDPASGLWEFWHLRSGEEPVREANGEWRIGGETGIVLVLVPSGTFTMGAERATTDPWAQDDEAPLSEVALDAFFIGKHEVTQGQWRRVMGDEPSRIVPKASVGSHPVETVPRARCFDFVRRLDLELPTEAQWERAARAGTRTVFFSGDAPLDLAGFANIADAAAAKVGDPRNQYTREFDDGFPYHAPVGSFRPNAFGLHDVLGNVWEWCRDPWYARNTGQRSGDGLREVRVEGTEGVIRGGSWFTQATNARVANRAGYDGTDKDLGLRVARRVDR